MLIGLQPEKVLFLVGPGQSGKSVLLRILSALVGEENTLWELPDIRKPGGLKAIKRIALIALPNWQTSGIGKIGPTMKLLLSGDTLLCRRPDGDLEAFVPKFALACALLTAPELDKEISARTLRINMTPVAADSRDPNLLRALLDEVSDITA